MISSEFVFFVQFAWQYVLQRRGSPPGAEMGHAPSVSIISVGRRGSSGAIAGKGLPTRVVMIIGGPQCLTGGLVSPSLGGSHPACPMVGG